MSKHQHVFIDAPLTLPQMATRLGELLETDAEPRRGPPHDPQYRYYMMDLPHGSRGALEDGDGYVDEPDLPLSQYTHVVEVIDPTRRGDDFEREKTAARALYDLVITRTPWAALLVFDDLNEAVASRDSLAHPA